MSSAVTRPQPPPRPTEKTVEISVKGRWITVPALDVCGNRVIVNGGWLKIASIHDEIWLEDEVGVPEFYVQRAPFRPRYAQISSLLRRSCL